MKTEAKTTKLPYRHTLAHIYANTRLSSRLYLEAAKRSSDAIRARSLEAIAVKRAMIANQLKRLARIATSSKEERTKSQPPRQPNVAELDRQIHRECDKLYQTCNDQNIRRFLREIMANVAGLAYHPDRLIHS